MQHDKPLCMECKYLYRPVDFKCKAFPKGIPKEIVEARVDHRKPYKGDNGIQFEKK